MISQSLLEKPKERGHGPRAFARGRYWGVPGIFKLKNHSSAFLEIS
jgi:hypothetical protein